MKMTAEPAAAVITVLEGSAATAVATMTVLEDYAMAAKAIISVLGGCAGAAEMAMTVLEGCAGVAGSNELWSCVYLEYIHLYITTYAMRKVLIIILLASIFTVGKSQTKNFIDQPYIEVNGYADTAITPDEIYIRIIISESDTKNKVALEDLESKMVDALKTLGIETEKDLTTNDVSSNFKYYFLRGTSVLKTKEYILKVSDAVTVTKVLIQLETLGISNTSIDHVDYLKLEDLKNLMRSKAVENAKTRAVALTKSLNQTVGAAIYIADSDVGNTYNNSSNLNEVVVMGYGTSKNQQPVLPKIEFQKIQVKTSINAKFILK